MEPFIGFGTWIDPESKMPASTLFSVTSTAIKVGYRTFDCAENYRTEPYVVSAILQSGLSRDQFFIISKDHHPPSVEELKERLVGEGLSYYDLFLLHVPPLVPISQFQSTLLQYWRIINSYLKAGLVSQIGISNFYSNELHILLQLCSSYNLTYPSYNEIEMHPLVQNKKLTQLCQRNNISVIAHTPLGGLASHDVLSNPIILNIANELGFTPAQIVLGWELKLGVSVIPRTFSEERMKENLDAIEVVPYLTQEYMELISSMDVGYPLIGLSQDAYALDMELISY